MDKVKRSIHFYRIASRVGLDWLAGHVWPSGRMFDTPGLTPNYIIALFPFFVNLRQQIRKEDHHVGDQWDLAVRMPVGCLPAAGLGELRP